MRNKSREYIAEIWAAVINLASILTLVVIDRFADIPEEVELVAGLTIVSITLVLLVFKQSIVSDFKDKLGIYRKLEALEDTDMREQGLRLVRELNIRLDELSNGVLVGSSPYLIRFLSDRIETAKYNVSATLLLDTPSQLYAWERPPATYYYETNKAIATTRGKRFSRIFILRRSEFVINDKFDADSKEIILRQQKDGLDVYIAWAEDMIQTGLREDFVIVDSSLVYVNDTGAVSTGGYKTRILKNTSEIENYQQKFAIIRAYARKPDQVNAILATE